MLYKITQNRLPWVDHLIDNDPVRKVYKNKIYCEKISREKATRRYGVGQNTRTLLGISNWWIPGVAGRLRPKSGFCAIDDDEMEQVVLQKHMNENTWSGVLLIFDILHLLLWSLLQILILDFLFQSIRGLAVKWVKYFHLFFCTSEIYTLKN